jgi:hypothetical protein
MTIDVRTVMSGRCYSPSGERLAPDRSTMENASDASNKPTADLSAPLTLSTIHALGSRAVFAEDYPKIVLNTRSAKTIFGRNLLAQGRPRLYAPLAARPTARHSLRNGPGVNSCCGTPHTFEYRR